MAALILLGAITAALLIHELGHAVAAEALGLRWRPVLTWHGPGIRIGSDELRLTRHQVVTTALAGPLASLAFAVAAFHVQPMLCLASLELGLFNLILPRSDGAAVLRELRGKTYWREG
jgi:hypothetical protein